MKVDFPSYRKETDIDGGTTLHFVTLSYEEVVR